MDEEK
jgi:serine/threonine protein kinase